MVAGRVQAGGLPFLASPVMPREAGVLPNLYEALPPMEAWADRRIDILKRPHPGSVARRRRPDVPPLSTLNSSRRLLQIYRGEWV